LIGIALILVEKLTTGEVWASFMNRVFVSMPFLHAAKIKIKILIILKTRVQFLYSGVERKPATTWLLPK